MATVSRVIETTRERWRTSTGCFLSSRRAATAYRRRISVASHREKEDANLDEFGRLIFDGADFRGDAVDDQLVVVGFE